jgi:hypothetical protein
MTNGWAAPVRASRTIKLRKKQFSRHRPNFGKAGMPAGARGWIISAVKIIKPKKPIETLILNLRGQKVILDADLAELYNGSS